MARDYVQWQREFSGIGAVVAGMEQRAGLFARKAALDIEAGAKTRAPVLTGFLRGSIQAVQLGPARWRVVVGAEYGIYVEYGTVRRGPTPFFNPAVDLVGPAFIAAMRTVAQP